MCRRNRSGDAHRRFRILKGTADCDGQQPPKTEQEILRSLLDYAVRLEGRPETTKLSMSLVLLVVCAKEGFANEDLHVVFNWLGAVLWQGMRWEETLVEQEVYFDGHSTKHLVERFNKLLDLVASANPTLQATVHCVAMAHLMESESVLLEVLRRFGNLCREATWMEVIQMLPAFQDRLHYLARVLRIPVNERVAEDWE